MHISKRAAKIVELRYFGGYTVEDVAEILDIGPATVERDSRFARSWLWREMTGKAHE
jgi:DNA-directed RNA polymerase specialized sigma24 family protein